MWTSLISLPPLPPVVLPNPDDRRFEKFKITESLLAMEHQDGKPVCAHILGMKSHIDRLIMLGASISNKLAVDWILQSLPESYDEFVREYHMMKHDATLIDLTYMLIAAESEMIWRSNGAYLSDNSTNHASVDNLGESTCSCCQGKGKWIRSCPKDLKSLRDGRVDKYGSTSGLEKREEV
ncbi:uncharacterized protein LOC128128453 [Lactuca sativa]|uniref:uncharacterized protein LOC128128453 n=1 Tax=Lactuca sativa TaxID=4236 RepID=UPI0022AFDB94|nr:uncharacterized protein LOC128128453 [Lactuca sativa]